MLRGHALLMLRSYPSGGGDGALMASRADGLFHAFYHQLHEPAGGDDRDADERQRGA